MSGVRKSRLVPCPATELICVLDEPLYPSDHIFIIWKIDVLRILPKYLYQQDIVRTKRIRDNKCLQSHAIAFIPVAYYLQGEGISFYHIRSGVVEC